MTQTTEQERELKDIEQALRLVREAHQHEVDAYRPELYKPECDRRPKDQLDRLGDLICLLQNILYAAQQASRRVQERGVAQAQQGLDKVTLLSKDHTGMKVDYRGLLGQVQREIKRSAPGHAEMIRQLQEHMQELGQRWYAGQTEVVDELLQLYCIESGARKAIAAQAKQGGA